MTATNRIMMGLGDYRFSLSTAAYQSLVRTNEYRWASHKRLGSRPARQFLGVGDEQITLEGVIYPFYKGGFGQLEKIRQDASLGEALILIDGEGKVWGDFTIDSLQETQTFFADGGLPQKVEFSLVLSNYGDIDEI